LKTEFICVEPKSPNAKIRFETMMDSLHSCKVEQRKDGKVFLSSITGRYFFCIPESGDDHWKIVK